MRKFSLILGFMLLCGVVRAESAADIVGRIPGLHQGVGFSLIDSQFNYLTTLDIVSWNGLSLEAGYSGRAKNTGDKLVAVISYNLYNAKDHGVKIPVLDLIDVRVGAYAGFGHIQIGDAGVRDGGNEFDAGLSATAINLKF